MVVIRCSIIGGGEKFKRENEHLAGEIDGG